jgi:hypothetical protein
VETPADAGASGISIAVPTKEYPNAWTVLTKRDVRASSPIAARISVIRRARLSSETKVAGQMLS